MNYFYTNCLCHFLDIYDENHLETRTVHAILFAIKVVSLWLVVSKNLLGGGQAGDWYGRFSGLGGVWDSVIVTLGGCDNVAARESHGSHLKV